jgi:3-hydroxyacyl-CoA dehydrogenase / 3-hydroxy-2-methylbutyryl-CoA dehydrogenase
MDPKGSIAVVTGGGSGLGLATARALLAAGASVALLDIDERVRDVATDLGTGVLGVPVDVGDDAAIEAALDAVQHQLGPVSIAVNCAGTTIGERTASHRGPHALDSFMKVLTVNLVGTFNVSRLAAARMATREPDENGERGVVVNTASIAAFDGQVGQVAYAASKGAVAAMTLPMARDLAKVGVRVATVAPGLFDTPMLRGLPAEMRASLASTVPFPHRLGEAEEYGALVVHIVTNRYLNGEVIRLDGALRLAPQ